jgi:hypothetical protein
MREVFRIVSSGFELITGEGFREKGVDAAFSLSSF